MCVVKVAEQRHVAECDDDDGQTRIGQQQLLVNEGLVVICMQVQECDACTTGKKKCNYGRANKDAVQPCECTGDCVGM